MITGTRKKFRRGQNVTTLALGSKRLYDFLHENSAVDLAPVDWVNDPRVIAREPNFVAINATTEVDFYGQCASETVGGRYYSSSGGQYDFSRGAMYSKNGQGFIVLTSTARGGTMSKIRPAFPPGRLSPPPRTPSTKSSPNSVSQKCAEEHFSNAPRRSSASPTPASVTN